MFDMYKYGLFLAFDISESIKSDSSFLKFFIVFMS